MKKTSCAGLAFLRVITLAALQLQPAASAEDSTEPDDRTRKLSQARIARTAFAWSSWFEQNEGQRDPAVRFVRRAPGFQLSLRSDGASIAVRKAAGVEGTRPTAEIVGLRLIGARADVAINGLDPLPGRVNSFMGADPSRWRTNIATFGKARYAGVYPGIDWVYHGAEGELEYDFVVAAGADPSMIRLAFEGPSEVRIESSGDLLLKLASGELRQHKPFAYQEFDGQRREVRGDFIQRGPLEVGFKLGAYDHSRELVIDPVLVYSTYFGSTAPEEAVGIRVGASGDAYVAGNTQTLPDFPFQNAFQTDRAAQFYDPKLGPINPTADNAFVMRLAPDGSLVYATYLGGRSSDIANGLDVDAAGNAYICGSTGSQPIQGSPLGFPVSAGAYRNSWEVGRFETGAVAFVAKISAVGGLSYATFLMTEKPSPSNGPGSSANAIAVSAEGEACVAGRFATFEFGSSTGMFVSKLNAAGSGLVYQKIIPEASPNGIALDRQGSAYVTGRTSSFKTVFPTTPGALHPAGQFDHDDIFFFKLSPNGADLLYSTLIAPASFGGTGRAVAVDSFGHAYVAGDIDEPNDNYLRNPRVFQLKNPAQAKFGGGQWDVFLAKFDPTKAGADSLLYATYLGGSGDDKMLPIDHRPGRTGAGLQVDALGRAYLTGATASTNFPVANAIQAVSGGGLSDAFVTVYNAAGSGLIFSTYLGGSGADVGMGIAVDLTAEKVFVTGETGSPNFPTLSAVQASLKGGAGKDAFITQIRMVQTESTFIVNSTNDIDDGACDSAHCSLREAINAANSHEGRETIRFNIPGPGVPTIKPQSPLPAITSPVVIDGGSQPVVHRVEIDGSAAGIDSPGLHLKGGNTELKGLAINRFSADGVLIENTGGNLVHDCYLGTDAEGMVAKSNRKSGVHIIDSPDNTIGGPGSNAISGNRLHGVHITGKSARRNKVLFNSIGVAINFEVPLGNLRFGVAIEDAPENIIGGGSRGDANVIRANLSGILIQGQSASNNVVQGNSIGGTSEFVHQQETGVLIKNARGNLIGGGISGGEDIGNKIVSHRLWGVWITGEFATGNRLEGNDFRPAKHDQFGIQGPSEIRNFVGLHIENAPSNIVGATNSRPNWIAQCVLDGVRIVGKGATENLIVGNQISDNGRDGVAIVGAVRNRIGRRFPEPFEGSNPGNAITGNTNNGVVIQGRTSLGNVVEGNYVYRNEQNGISIEQAVESVIDSNLIAANSGNGVRLMDGARGSILKGNTIGLSNIDLSPNPNFNGVFIDSSPGNLIGGPTDSPGYGDGNIISGNNEDGVRLSGLASVGNRIQGNLIGLDRESLPKPNRNGVRVMNASTTLVGGPELRFRNVISGNLRVGVLIGRADDVVTTVQGNLIGTDRSGLKAVLDGPSAESSMVHPTAIELEASDSLIGGLSARPGLPPGNVISGNPSNGINVTDSSRNIIQGNIIGATADGDLPLPNLDGIYVAGRSSNNLIGGTEPGAGNLISGNFIWGIKIEGDRQYPLHNRIEGNLVGTDISGLASLPARSHAGIAILTSMGNVIGGIELNAGNTIAFNKLGVRLQAGAGQNLVQRNSIFENLFGGILAEDSNNWNRHPRLMSAWATGDTIQVRGYLTVSNSIEPWSLEFFGNRKCGDAGYGEGKSFLGAQWVRSATSTPPVAGILSQIAFSATLPRSSNPSFITATSTSASGATSEFSNCVPVQTAIDSDGDGVFDSIEVEAAEAARALDYFPPFSKEAFERLPSTAALWSSQSQLPIFIDVPVQFRINVLSTPPELGAATSPLPIPAQFPHGFIRLTILPSKPPGQSGLHSTLASMVATFRVPSAPPVNAFMMFGLEPGNPKPHWYDFTFDGTTGAVVEGNVLKLHLADGRRGDADALVDGAISIVGALAYRGEIPLLITDYFPVSFDHFFLRVSGEAGRVHVVQSSTNLLAWTSISTNTTATGFFEHTGSVPPGDAARYYRIARP